MLSKLLEQLQREKSKLALGLVDVPRKTLEDYVVVVGQCQGLQAAIDIINYLLEDEDDHSRRDPRTTQREADYG